MLGKKAIVVGAGVGGVAAARLLIDYFDEVVLFERDRIPERPDSRKGVPQGHHGHLLLSGGRQALSQIFPNLIKSLSSYGSIPFEVGSNYRVEFNGSDPFPSRNLGIEIYSQTRGLLEWVMHQELKSFPQIHVRFPTQVLNYISSDNGRKIIGVNFIDRETESPGEMKADLVIDASGGGLRTSSLMNQIHCAAPEFSEVKVGMYFASAIFRIPEVSSRQWKAVKTVAYPPYSSRFALMLPIEPLGQSRFCLTLGARFGEKPPTTVEACRDFLTSLRSTTVLDAIQSGECESAIFHRFSFPKAVWNHFERLPVWPAGLVPLGDTICKFNPVYGQGMTVAIQQVSLLGTLLDKCMSSELDFSELPKRFLREAQDIIRTPWLCSSMADFSYPETLGDKPENLSEWSVFWGKLNKAALKSEKYHKQMIELLHLVRDGSTSFNELQERLKISLGESEE